MDQLIQSAPNIIEQAAKSPLGIFALMIIALSVLGFFFFRESSEHTRITMFVLMFTGVVAFGIATFRSTSSGVGTTAANALDVNGSWKAKVKYSWGDIYDESFTFRVVNGELSGTASYLKSPRGISEGVLKGNTISFAVSLDEILGQEKKAYRNQYKGIVSNNEIRFTMQDTRGNPPIEFTAAR